MSERKLIEAIVDGDVTKANSRFEGLMAERMQRAMEAKRIDVADSMYNGGPDSADAEEEENAE